MATIWRWKRCSPTSARSGITDIVDLGDMASGPLDARRTMDILMALDAVHVRGNHDRWLVDRPFEKMGAWERPAFAQLDSRHLAWLRTRADDACLSRSGFSLPCDTRGR